MADRTGNLSREQVSALLEGLDRLADLRTITDHVLIGQQEQSAELGEAVLRAAQAYARCCKRAAA